MIEWIIRRSVANRFLVMMGALFLSIWGTWTIINTPVDALPDLSDVQVIIKTSYPGQAPQINRHAVLTCFQDDVIKIINALKITAGTDHILRFGHFNG